jgi:hypothetical protein
MHGRTRSVGRAVRKILESPLRQRQVDRDPTTAVLKIPSTGPEQQQNLKTTPHRAAWKKHLFVGSAIHKFRASSNQLFAANREEGFLGNH